MKYMLFSIAALFVSVITSATQASELNVQGGTTTGGDQSLIRGRVGGLCRFSVTGAFNDIARAQLGSSGGNTVVSARSIRELATMPAAHLLPLVRYSVEQLPNGQTRVLLGVQNAQTGFNGGRVTVSRGSTVIDSDPVIIH